MGFTREALPLLNSPLALFSLNEGKMVSFEFSSPLLAIAFKSLQPPSGKRPVMGKLLHRGRGIYLCSIEGGRHLLECLPPSLGNQGSFGYNLDLNSLLLFA